MKDFNFSLLPGVTFASITMDDFNDRIVFVTTDGRTFSMHHDQDCCESVSVERVAGNLADLIGDPIIAATETIVNEPPPGSEVSDDSNTWTTFTLATAKASVTIQWHGSSNGYYSESVSFVENT